MLQWNFPSFKMSKLDHKFICTRVWFCFYTRFPGTREQAYVNTETLLMNIYIVIAVHTFPCKESSPMFPLPTPTTTTLLLFYENLGKTEPVNSEVLFSLARASDVIFVFMSYLYVLLFYILYLPSTMSRREKAGVRCDWAKLMNSNNLQARELLEVSP